MDSLKSLERLNEALEAGNDFHALRVEVVEVMHALRDELLQTASRLHGASIALSAMERERDGLLRRVARLESELDEVRARGGR